MPTPPRKSNKIETKLMKSHFEDVSLDQFMCCAFTRMLRVSATWSIITSTQKHGVFTAPDAHMHTSLSDSVLAERRYSFILFRQREENALHSKGMV